MPWHIEPTRTSKDGKNCMPAGKGAEGDQAPLSCKEKRVCDTNWQYPAAVIY
jgi:hypothetical protein